MERFIGTSTADTYLRNWDICHIVGNNFFFPCDVEVSRLGLEPVRARTPCTYFPRWHSLLEFRLTDPLWRQCIDCCLISGVVCANLVSSPVMIQSRNSSPSHGTAAEMSKLTPCDLLLFWCQVTMFGAFNYFDLPHFTVGGSWNKKTSIFNRCNDTTVRTREVSLMHASCDVINLSRKCSRFTQYMIY